jgi:hypothetical protein
LTAGVIVGTKTSAGTPSSAATWATANPALPPDATITPDSGSSPRSRAESTRLNMPRGLNEPVCCNCSSFSHTESEAVPMTGVRRTLPAIRAAADSTSIAYIS